MKWMILLASIVCGGLIPNIRSHNIVGLIMEALSIMFAVVFGMLFYYEHLEKPRGKR